MQKQEEKVRKNNSKIRGKKAKEAKKSTQAEREVCLYKENEFSLVNLVKDFCSI